MGLDDSIEPPKKKLKQAQLPYCNQLVKLSKKKISSEITMDNKVINRVEDINHDIVVNKENLVVISDDDNSEELGMVICETSPVSKAVPTISESGNNPIAGTETNMNERKIKEFPADCKSEHLENHDKKLENFNVEVVACSNEENFDNSIGERKSDDEVINSEEEILKETEAKSDNENKSMSMSSDDEKVNINLNNSTTPLSDPDSSTNTLKRKLTPPTASEKRKQRESIKQQREREKEAKWKLKLEKEEQKRKEKEEREDQKRKEKEEKDQKRKEKEEKEEQKRKEKEEKERRKIAELKQKEDEKRLKEEERRRKEEAKGEEKRLKEEERRRKEEAKEEERRKKEEAKLIEQRKEDQAKKVFSKFFISKKSKTENVEQGGVLNDQPKFMPFPIKPEMRIAVDCRRYISESDKTKLDAYFNEVARVDNKLYLSELKNGDHIPLKSEPTWPLSEEQHDVIVIESVVDGVLADDSPENNKKSRRKHKAKLLQFHENRRPAYWGTWRKKSENVTPRRPLLKDVSLNYEVDSDFEWEDEGEGEDIGNEDDSDKENSDEENCEEKNENGYILDNTFVPHGYLSDEEVHPDEEIFDPEDHKLRLRVLKEEFDEEMKMKAERLKPRLLGCVWISNDTTAVSKGSLYEILMGFRAIWEEDGGPIQVAGPVVEESPATANPRSKPFSPLVMEQLVKFIHGNNLPFLVMVKEFRSLMEKEDYPLLSKRAISLKIKEIATKEQDESGKQFWAVNNELYNEYVAPSLSQLNNSNTEKNKDTFLDNFLKRPSVSPQNIMRNVPKPDPEAVISSTVLPPPSTPAPPPVKKRATLITLPQTPTNSINTIKVHKDTPRPVHPFFKNTLFKEPTTNLKPQVVTDTTAAADCIINLCNDD